MKAISDYDWAALKRDIAAISGLRRHGLTNREDNALSRLARLKRKMDRKDRKDRKDIPQ